jgi:translocation and assembly module TamB
VKRRWLRWTLAGLALLLGLAGWLLSTASGARWVFDQVATRVTGLSAGAVEGSLAGGLVLRDLAWSDGTHRLEAAEVELAASIGRVLVEPRRLERLVARGVVLALENSQDAPAGDRDAAPSPLPALSVDRLQLADARIAWPSGAGTAVAVDAAIALSGQRIELSNLAADIDGWRLAGAATVDLDRAALLAAARLKVDRPGDPALAASLDVDAGDGSDAVSVQVSAPLALRIEGQVAHDLATARLVVVAPRQDVEAWGLGEGFAADFVLDWDGARLRPRGTVAREGLALALVDGSVQPSGDGATVEALAVDWAGHGTVRADGFIPYSDARDWELALRTQRIAIPRGEAPPLVVRGELAVTGGFARPRLAPALTLDAAGFPTATTSGAIELADDGLRLAALSLSTGAGALELEGVVDAADGDAITLKARGLDPAQFLPDWPGRLDADLAWKGRMRGDPASGALELQRLEGRLRGRALSGSGTLRIDAGALGASRFTLQAGRARLDVALDAVDGPGEARLDVPDLADLAPGLAGRIEATWTRDARDRVVARAEGLRAQGWRLLRGELDVDLPRGAQGEVAGELRLDDIGFGGQRVERALAKLAGTRAEHQVALEITQASAQARLRAQASGGWSGDAWSGRLQLVEADAGRLAARLREPATLEWRDDQGALGPACLDAVGGSACFEVAGKPGDGRATLRLDGWSLAALRPLWPTLPELEGLLDGTAQVAWRGGALVSGDVALQSPRGLARLPDRPDLDLGYRALSLTGQWTETGGRLDGGADLIPDGRLDLAATLTPGVDGVPGVDATLDVLVRQLDGIEAFTTVIAEPEGEIRGQLRLQGGALPSSISGALALTGFTAQVPSRAIRVRDGVLVLAGVPGQLVVRGSAVSGDGRLTLDGRIDADDPVPTLLHVGGDAFRFSNTPTLSLVATPDLTLARRDGRWQLDGRLDIPRARVDAGKLESGVDRSPDIVVADAEQPAEAARPWRARVKVVLGDDVRLEGFGFDGTLAGELDITQRQGAQAVANGEITLRGRYQAYGQRLQIERGGLRYANSPLAEPTLDLRAERKVRDRTVALQITGNALRPESQIVGTQGLSDTEALALLVTGRPLNQAGSGDRERLSDAAAALGTVGSDLLTRNLRGRLGLDELGVSNDTALDGEAFTLGKYLSPRLYVGYGIGLLTRGEVFTVRYLVTDRIELEANAGSSTRAAVNWRLER